MNNVIVFDLSTEGLEPLKHRIIGITTKTATEEKIFTHRDEKKVLEDFWSYINENEFEKFVGFNSNNFDIPMLIVRSIKHKVRMYNIKEKSVDLRNKIFGDEHKKGTLHNFQELLDIKYVEEGYAKMHMSLLWQAGHLKDLKEYLLRDVRITWKLYENLLEVGL